MQGSNGVATPWARRTAATRWAAHGPGRRGRSRALAGSTPSRAEPSAPPASLPTGGSAGAAPAPPPRPGLREGARAHARGVPRRTQACTREVRASLGGRRFAPRCEDFPPPRRVEAPRAHPPLSMRGCGSRSGGDPEGAGVSLAPGPAPGEGKTRRSRSVPPGARLSRRPQRSNLLGGRRAPQRRDAEPGAAELPHARGGPALRRAARRGALPSPRRSADRRSAQRSGWGSDRAPTDKGVTAASPRLASPRRRSSPSSLPSFLPSFPPLPPAPQPPPLRTPAQTPAGRTGSASSLRDRSAALRPARGAGSLGGSPSRPQRTRLSPPPGARGPARTWA